jgi:divalent metal cation (Fe/Co/Zn/Cd) transporter
MAVCVKRTKIALEDLTDKTLPEEQQMKILRVLNRYYDSYSQFHAINSHKSGEVTKIDLHLSFENSTSFEEILTLKKKLQDEFDSQFGNCEVNILVEEG